MNKSIVAIAAAGLVSAIGFTSVASAEATVYGRVTAGAVHVDNDKTNDDGAWNLGAVGQGSNSSDNDGRLNNTRFGFKGSQDLGNGMSAGFQIEREVREKHTPAVTRQRHNLVWLSGSWGKLTAGFQGNPYMNARHWDQTYFYGGNWGASYRHEGINYSMSNGPFSLNIMALGQVESDDGTLDVAGSTADAGTIAAVIAGSGETSGNDGIDGWIVHAGYDFGPVALNVSHHADNKDVDIVGATGATGTGDDEVASRAAATLRNNSAADVNSSRDRTAIGVNGSVGALDWYLAYETSELNASGSGFEDNDTSSVGGFLGFSASEKDTIYGYYVAHSADRNNYKHSGMAPDGTTNCSATAPCVTLGEDYTETIIGYSRAIGPGVRFIAEYVSHDLDLEGGSKGSDPSKLALALRYVF